MLRVQLDIARAAVRWEREGRQEEDLWRGGRLARIQELRREDRLLLAGLEADLVEASMAAAELSRREAEGRRRRELEAARDLAQAKSQSARRFRWGFGVALVLLALAGIATLVATRRGLLAERRLMDAVEVADLIVFRVDRDLENVAGAAVVRRDLLEAGGELLDKLVAAGGEGSFGVQRSRMTHHIQRGDLALSHGELTLAYQQYQQAMELARKLVAAAPTSTLYLNDLSVSHNKIGDVLKSQGELGSALSEYRASYEIARRLSDQDPDNAGWQTDVVGSCWRVAHAIDPATAEGRSEAIRCLERALAILRRLDASGRLAPYWQEWIPKYEQALGRFDDR